jgi:hypothetical protein
VFGRRKRDGDRDGRRIDSSQAESPSPGWQAIDDALVTVYGDAIPRHVGYQPPPPFSHNLQGCSAHWAGDHWHYVSYGLSELYVPDPDDDPRISGWGFELTLRAPGDASEPPAWPFMMINEMAKRVNGNRVLLQLGDRIDLQGPVTGYPNVPDAPPTGLTIFAIGVDRELGRIETPNGRVEFLQLVGVTEEEKAQMLASSTSEVLNELADSDGFLITRPDRA